MGTLHRNPDPWVVGIYATDAFVFCEMQLDEDQLDGLEWPMLDKLFQGASERHIVFCARIDDAMSLIAARLGLEVLRLYRAEDYEHLGVTQTIRDAILR